jgi:hypothetical protein
MAQKLPASGASITTNMHTDAAMDEVFGSVISIYSHMCYDETGNLGLGCGRLRRRVQIDFISLVVASACFRHVFYFH